MPAISKSIWIPIGRILIILGGFFGLRALTEIVTPEQYGRLTLVTGLISLVSLVVYTSLGKSTDRYIWDYKNESRGHLWVASAFISVVVLGVVFTLIFWGALALGIDFNLNPGVASWTIPVFLVVGGLSTILLSILNILQHHEIFVLGSIASVWLKSGLAIMVALLIAPTAESIMIGYAIGVVLVLVGVLWVIRREGLIRFSLERTDVLSAIWIMAQYALPFAFVSLFYWIQTTANRYVLDLGLGVDQVGIFVVAATVARLPIQSIESIFGQIHQPRLYARIGKSNEQDVDISVRQHSYAEYVLSFFVITLPILGFTIVGSDLLIQMLAGANYWEGAEIIPWIVTAEFLRSLTAVLMTAFEIEKRPRGLIFSVGISAIVTIILTFFLIEMVGSIGAGIALVVGTLVWLILTGLPASRMPCWNIPWKKLSGTVLMSLCIAGVALLTRSLVHDYGFLVETISFLIVFGVSYLLYAGQRILNP